MTDTNKTADENLAEVTKQLTAVQAELALASAMAGLSDAEKAIHKSLDKDGQMAFLKLSPGERLAKVQAASDANGIAYTSLSGDVFRKNEDPRLVAMAKRADEQEKALAAERAVRKVEDLRKRAESELKHFPKDLAVKAALLGAIESAISDEPTRTAAKEMLKAGNEALSKHFGERGSAGAGSPPPSDAAEAHEKLEKLATELRSKDTKLSELDAYVKACELNPEVYEQAVGTTVGTES